jgi:hypothetical protein
MKIMGSCCSFIAFLFIGLTVAVSSGATAIYAQQPRGEPDGNNQLPPGPLRQFPMPFDQLQPFGQARNFTFGPIASIQNNESGQPAWLVIGHWRGNLLSFNETAATIAGQNGSNNNTSRVSTAVFNADLRMIMLNGSGAHTHVITNFKLSNASFDQNGTRTYIGNSTISMREGPVVDVSTTIKVTGPIISIFPDPSKVKEHFGNTPIYGVVQERELEHGMRGPFPPSRGPPLP